MDPFAPSTLLTALIIALGLLMSVYVVAAHVLRALHVHDLTCEAHELRNQYARRLEALRRGAVTEVEMVEPGLHEPLVGVDIIDEETEAQILAQAA